MMHITAEEMIKVVEDASRKEADEALEKAEILIQERATAQCYGVKLDFADLHFAAYEMVISDLRKAGFSVIPMGGREVQVRWG